MIHLIPGPHPTSRDISKALIKSNMQPKKWAIKRTPETYEEINKWADCQMGYEDRGYLADKGFIHSEKLDDTCLPHYAYGGKLKPGFTAITIEQFREITNPTKSNTMNKETLIKKLKDLSSNSGKLATGTGTAYYCGQVAGVTAAICLIQQLPDDGEITQGKGEPGLLPFKWPVPDGFEVVSVDELTGNHHLFTNVQEPDYNGFVACRDNGEWWVQDIKDLFLRLTPPEDLEGKIVKAAVNSYNSAIANGLNKGDVHPVFKAEMEAVENYLNHKSGKGI